MSRINYTDEEDFSGQFALWQANCQRSMKGKVGQRELRVLRDALLALPDKRLIHGSLYEGSEVCAVGAYIRHKGIDLEKFDNEYESDEAGIAAGMPALVAWAVVAQNDEMFDNCTPEERYVKMLAWVESKFKMPEVQP